MEAGTRRLAGTGDIVNISVGTTEIVVPFPYVA
jgi:hypothetical protein